MSRDLGQDVLDLENFYAKKLWADFSFPRLPSEVRKRKHKCNSGWGIYVDMIVRDHLSQ